jgi:hypothetical protein
MLLALFACAGCERDPSAEARMFLDRFDRIDLDDPIEERQRLVDNLTNMPLAADEVRRVRDVCVDAHQSALEAETLQVRARDTVAQYEGTIPYEVGRGIERDIRGSGRALERSRTLFSRCLDMRARLERKYRSRRERR